MDAAAVAPAQAATPDRAATAGTASLPCRSLPAATAAEDAGATAGHRCRADACCSSCGSGGRSSTRASRARRRASRCWLRPSRSSPRASPNCRHCRRSSRPRAARKEREDASWQGLVKLYEAMRPRDAATIFNELEMPVLLQVVDRMKEAKAAPVLAAMQPDKARDLTAQARPDAGTQRRRPRPAVSSAGDRTGRRSRCRSTNP